MDSKELDKRLKRIECEHRVQSLREKYGDSKILNRNAKTKKSYFSFDSFMNFFKT